ncbi:MAG: sigma-70 family RNA polymerase sigma factor [Candidatus Omnitrophota bacterium]|nr:sigma-70 family RNA polymerase sigma factor [Candidatus Omnitrophota bacterium]
MKNEFEKIIKRLSPTIRKISYRMNGHFTFFNDDDLCQEALVHLWALFQNGELDDKTDSYILQGCYFHLKNYTRTSMDKVSFSSLESPIDEDGTMLGETIASNDPLQGNQVEEKLLCEELRNSSLDRREIKITDMSMEGMTVRQIGEKLGISHVAVIRSKKRIRTKCEKLRRELKRGYQN